MQTEPPLRKLLDRVRDRIRVKHYSYRTEETYVQWITGSAIALKIRHFEESAETE